MSNKYKHIYKSHNASLILYHFVFVVKYRKSLIDNNLDQTISDVCLQISEKYEIFFHEIGSDDNHIHFLIQSTPIKSPSELSQIIKSILAKEIFKIHPIVRKELRGGQFWTDGYYVNTVGGVGIDIIEKYIKSQGNKVYKSIYKATKQCDLFGNDVRV